MCGKVGSFIDNAARNPTDPLLHPTATAKRDLETFGLKKKGPPMVDPAAERLAAEAKATQDANSRIALQRKAMRENSLLTGGGLAPSGGGGQTLGVG
jgi:hypothetical protein